MWEKFVSNVPVCTPVKVGNDVLVLTRMSLNHKTSMRFINWDTFITAWDSLYFCQLGQKVTKYYFILRLPIFLFSNSFLILTDVKKTINRRQATKFQVHSISKCKADVCHFPKFPKEPSWSIQRPITLNAFLFLARVLAKALKMLFDISQPL